MDRKELSRIMSIDADNLDKVQHDSLKKFALDKLDTVKYLIETEQYNRVEEVTFYSGQGDGLGDANENYCINFAYKENHEMDIMDVVEKLIILKKYIK